MLLVTVIADRPVKQSACGKRCFTGKQNKRDQRA